MVANDCFFNAFVHGEHKDILTSWWCNLNLPASSRFAFVTNYLLRSQQSVAMSDNYLSSLPPPVFWISSHINKVSSGVRGTKKVIKETQLSCWWRRWPAAQGEAAPLMESVVTSGILISPNMSIVTLRPLHTSSYHL